MKKLCALLVCLLLLSACGQTTAEETAAPDPGVRELSAETVILTIDDQPVYWPEFNYYLDYIASYYRSANGLEEITDWDAIIDGLPLEEYFLSYAVSLAANHRGLEKMAAELGAGLTPEQEAAIDETIENGEAVYGSGEYRAMVERSYNTVENFCYLQQIGFLTDNVFAALYGPQGQNCDDETVLRYAGENDYMCAKFICVEDSDENRRSMEQLAESLAQSDRPEELFDELMDEYSQYTLLTSAAFPGGMLFARGYLGDAFDRAYASLEVGQISGVCQGPGELYIIRRLPLDPDRTTNEGGFTLRHCVAYALFEQDMESWGNGLDCVHEDGYFQLVDKGLRTFADQLAGTD